MFESKERTYNLRVLVMGDEDSEKSKILTCIRKNQYQNGDYTSSNDDRISHKLQYKENCQVILDIHNYRQERTNSSYPLRSIDIVLIVYSSNNHLSFNNIDNWYREVERFSKNYIQTVLVAFHPQNTTHVVDLQQGQAIAEKIGLPFTQISENDFESIQQALIHVLNQLPSLSPKAAPAADKDDDPADSSEPSSRSKCCMQ